MEVSLGINMAVMQFNDGHKSCMGILFEKENMNVPCSSKTALVDMDKVRIQKSEKSMTGESKKKRKEKRKSKLRQLDAFQKDEGITYQSGSFHSKRATPNEGKNKSQPRKQPRCKQCNQVMKGHPRGKCVTSNIPPAADL